MPFFKFSTLYSPTVLVSTVFSFTFISDVKSTSSLSLALTPLNSSNVSPTFNVTSLASILGSSLEGNLGTSPSLNLVL